MLSPYHSLRLHCRVLESIVDGVRILTQCNDHATLVLILRLLALMV
jgi:hypothetical protein